MNKIYEYIEPFKKLIIWIKNNIIDEIIVKSISFCTNLILKIIALLLRNLIVSVILSFFSSVSLYYFFPELFEWILIKLNISDANAISLIKDVKDREEQINQLKEELQILNQQKDKAISEKEGIKLIMNDYKGEKNTYLILFLGVVVVGGLVYIMLHSTDAAHFKIINDSLKSLNDTITQSNASLTMETMKRLNQMAKTHDAETQTLNNAICLVIEKLKDLSGKGK